MRSLVSNPKKMRLWVLIFLCGLLTLIFHKRLLQIPARVLLVPNSLSTSADALIMLMGNLYTRPNFVAYLYKQNLASKIIFCTTAWQRGEPGQSEIENMEAHISFLLLKDYGVPSMNLEVVDCKSRNTLEEAHALRNHIEGSYEQISSIILVTDWDHMARALTIFRREFKNSKVEIHPASTGTIPRSGERGWQSDVSFYRVFREYLKWVYYFVRFK